MNSGIQEYFAKLEGLLDKLLSGEYCAPVREADFPAEGRTFIKKLNHLIEDLNEMEVLASDLAEGRLNGEIPLRHNYMASSLKQLHSMLCVVTQSCRQLQSGQIISRLPYTGELFNVINGLIDTMGSMLIQKTEALHDIGLDSPVNSWRYHQILQALNLLCIGILETDENGHVVYLNRPAAEVLGEIQRIPDKHSDCNVLLKHIREINIDDALPILADVYNRENEAWYRITSDKFSLPSGQSFCLHMLENVSDWKKANMDTMTGTLNRRAGLEKLEELLSGCEKMRSYALIFIDLDGLKDINDKYGHNEGDYAIKAVSQVLISHVRDMDVVCRYGGDEFFIILKGVTKETAGNIIERMHWTLEEINNRKTKPYRLAFSHGIELITWPQSLNISAAQILAMADQKMYQHKKSKKEK